MTNWSHGLRRRSVVQSMLHAIFDGRFHSGQRLVVQKLADEFGVSPTPIREALVELAGIGVVELLPNRGAVVRQVTWQELSELCQIRRVLEAEATRSAVGRLDTAALKQLIVELKRLVKYGQDGKVTDLPKFVEETRALDSRLHDLIAAACGSRRLSAEIVRYKMLFRAFRDVTYAKQNTGVDFEHMLQENVDHLAIAEALEADDARAASKAMSKHIDSVMRFWGQLIIDAIAPPDDQGGRTAPRERIAPPEKSESNL